LQAKTLRQKEHIAADSAKSPRSDTARTGSKLPENWA
jgi:hypothetical protein